MRILDDIIVKVVPKEFPGGVLRCRVIAKVGGKIEHNFEKVLPADDFESRFHRFMHIAEEEIVRIAKKLEEDATAEQKAIPSP